MTPTKTGGAPSARNKPSGRQEVTRSIVPIPDLVDQVLRELLAASALLVRLREEIVLVVAVVVVGSGCGRVVL